MTRAAGLREAAEICSQRAAEYKAAEDDEKKNAYNCELVSMFRDRRIASTILANQIMARATAAEKSAPTEDEALADGPSWIDRIAVQYGARQLAALRGDAERVADCNKWLHILSNEHWHEIIAALRHKEPT